MRIYPFSYQITKTYIVFVLKLCAPTEESAGALCVAVVSGALRQNKMVISHTPQALLRGCGWIAGRAGRGD
jgi:hypothetical protein